MTIPTQMPESLKVPEELAAIRELCVGSVEWRCCTEDGAYCMSFDRDNSLNPEREANEWLENHQRDYPHRFMAYKVRRVVVQSQLQEEALALITRFSALQSALKDRDAEIERLKAMLSDASTLLKRTPRVCMDTYNHGDKTSFGAQAKALVRAIDSMKGGTNGL